MSFQLPTRDPLSAGTIGTLSATEEGENEYPEDCSPVAFTSEEITALESLRLPRTIDEPSVDFEYPAETLDPNYTVSRRS